MSLGPAVQAMRGGIPVVLLVLALSGCVGALDPGLTNRAAWLCPTDVKQDVARTTFVVADELTEFPASRENPHVTVHALPGQWLTGQATWTVVGGDADAEFDGPTGTATKGPGVWQWTAQAPHEGNFTLRLVGQPIAYDVTYVLQLTVSGCSTLA